MLGALRPVARLLTGSTYVVLGYGTLHEPGPIAEESAPVHGRDSQENSTSRGRRASCEGQRGHDGGVLLAAGVVPRQSALVLAGSMIPTTVAAHSFWNEKDPVVRKRQKVQFHKNMAVIGGLLFAALDQPIPDLSV
jgi:hypothetical protein